MVGDYTGLVNTTQEEILVADKTRKIQVRLTETELSVLKYLAENDGAEGMSDWICQAIWRRARQLNLHIQGVPVSEQKQL